MALSATLTHSIQTSQRTLGMGLFVPKEDGSIINGTILSRIENDPHIRAVLEKRFNGVANKAVEVIARAHVAAEAKGDPLDELEYADERGVSIVEQVLSYANMPDARRWLARSRLSGVAVVVIDWIVRDGLIVPWFRPVDFDWVGFKKVDPDFECSRLGHFGIVVNRGGIGQPLPPRRAIAVNYGSRSDNPWGWGLGETLYYPKEIATEMLKFALIHGDRYASPITVTEESGDNVLSPGDRDKLEVWLADLNQQAYGCLPPGVTAKTIGGDRGGGDFFLDTMDKITAAISRLVLGETGTTDQTGEGGSRARDEVAADQQDSIVKGDCSEIDNILTETLSHWIVELNAPGAIPPVIRTVWPKDKTGEIELKKSSADATRVAIENYKSLTEMGFVPEDEDSPFEGWVRPKAEGVDGEEPDSMQASALNGSQITSLQQIIEAVSEGRIPPDTGKYLIKAGFPSLSMAMIDRMINPVKEELAKKQGPSRWETTIEGTPEEGGESPPPEEEPPEPPPEDEPMEFAANEEGETPDSLKKLLTPVANAAFSAFTTGVARTVARGESLEEIREGLDNVEYSPALGVLLGGAMSAAHVIGINQVKKETE